MDTIKRKARIAGLTYLLIFTAPFSLIYVPNKLFVRDNPAATASNILAHETMFRLAIVNELFTAVAFVFLGMALFRLLADVNRTLAWLMVLLGGVICAPLTFIGVTNEVAALTLLRSKTLLSVFSKPQLDALALTFYRLHGQGIIVSEIFWGLWLIPFGLLVIKSGFLPRFLGGFLIANGLAYVAVSVTNLLFPPYANVVERWAFIPYTGELWIVLFLLTKGTLHRPELLSDVAVA